MTRPGIVALDARGRLRVSGKDRVRFLQGMLTNDVAGLGPGQSLRGACCSPCDGPMTQVASRWLGWNPCSACSSSWS